jgi:hypothetical protein
MTIVEIIKFLETGNDVDAQLEAFKQLNACAAEKDLPVLLAAVKSETSNFWVRERCQNQSLISQAPRQSRNTRNFFRPLSKSALVVRHTFKRGIIPCEKSDQQTNQENEDEIHDGDLRD